MHMKNIILQKSIVLIITACIVLAFLCSCNSSKIKYYSQKENYKRVTGVVTSVKYNEDATIMYIDLCELSPALDDTCFKIVGENLKMLKANKIDDKLKMGEQITFITAPKYFGDGYVMPIVAISISGENLLDFEEGYNNLLDWLSK